MNVPLEVRRGGIVLAALALAFAPLAAQQSTSLDLPGLQRAVEIRVDRWGIAHIYAENEHDLFFAQGWNAARDRLFQLELWRRQATGTVSEILGPRELQRDVGTRLFQFRRDLEQELRHYHPRGVEIVGAYVEGINAYIADANRRPGDLPLEFQLLGIRPGVWTPDVVISRHQGLLGNIGSELSTGRLVAALGPEKVKRLDDLGPGDPDLTLDPAIDGAALSQDILGIYNAFRSSIRFRPEDIVAEHRGDVDGFEGLERAADVAAYAQSYDPAEGIGSNNWVVSGRLSESGYPLMANDPHRAQGSPSLRYWVHLVAPGWDVIGGGEPSLPGVSIGHNEYGAWGLTVFATDGEDLYVYETNPADPNEYRYRGAWGLTVFATDGEDLYVYDTNPSDPDEYRYRGEWEAMTVIREEIPVKGQRPHTAELKYTRHGPVVFEDKARHKAYAVRAAWMEIGGAPYLASLRMDQATTWEEFREACAYSHIPGENMIWAGRDGTIGWQAVGIAPIRRNSSGLVPVPGDGRYEWDGYLPIKAKPHVVNPAEGFFATANNDLIPRDYPHMDAVGYEWSDPYRWLRITEVLASGRRQSMVDMMRLQTDELAVPARQLVPMLAGLETPDNRTLRARNLLLDWDYVLDRNSAAAGLYVAWEGQLRRLVGEALVPPGVRMSLSLRKTIETLAIPPGELGSDPMKARDKILMDALVAAMAELTAKLGPDSGGWRWGQPDYHHAMLRHPLGNAVDEATRQRLEAGPLPRGGYGSTVNATGNSDNQTSGASFRIIVDTGDWDRAVGMNTPGQSGDVRDPHYRDLFEDWSLDRFFPVVYSRARVEAATDRVIQLNPGR
ncbi:MAG TPA: penicillin acylase family protein [Longimicrobiales bacterium]|nr:penicillin acylase family protein [Longimicrobiales bacterium]